MVKQSERIKQLTSADYDEVFALSQFAFQYKLSEKELSKKKEETNLQKIWGWVEEGRIAAKVHVLPLSVLIHGKRFEMGGVASVATWPEYRRTGMVKNLLAHALNHMKQDGQLLSYLHPFSVPFYRKFGWEIVFDKKYYTIPMDSLKKDWKAKGFVRRNSATIEVLHRIYTDFANNFSGMLMRDENWWKQRILAKDNMVAVCYGDNEKAEGYVIYSVKNNLLEVEEFIYTSLNGKKLLLEFIANHDSMAKEVKMTVQENDNLPLLVDEPRFKQETTPYFMARIVDVPLFLNQYPFEHVSHTKLAIHVEDAFLPENNGIYEISKVDGQTQFSIQQSTEVKNQIHCTVGQLTAMLIGYKRPQELAKLGLIKGNMQAIDKLEKLIPEKQTYFPDFF